jgi:hypothetical protein
MKNKIIYYTLICLVTLILTSVLYVINNDNIYEFSGEYRTQANSNLAGAYDIASERKTSAWGSAFINYWNQVISDNTNANNTMTSCPADYTSFLENIATDVGVLINNEPSCQNYITNEISLNELTNNLGETGVAGLYSIDLGDSGSDVRVKGTCLKNVFDSADDIKGRLDSYNNFTGTSLAKCQYLATL